MEDAGSASVTRRLLPVADQLHMHDADGTGIARGDIAASTAAGRFAKDKGHPCG